MRTCTQFFSTEQFQFQGQLFKSVIVTNKLGFIHFLLHQPDLLHDFLDVWSLFIIDLVHILIAFVLPPELGYDIWGEESCFARLFSFRFVSDLQCFKSGTAFNIFELVDWLKVICLRNGIIIGWESIL